MALQISMEKGESYAAGAVALFVAAAAITIALGFEHIGGYLPCQLCYMERWGYYGAIPLLFFGLVLASGGVKDWAAALFLAAALCMLANGLLGVYHAGAEWKFWPGPTSCGGNAALTATAGSLINDIQNIHVVRCDEASLRILGLSFAGWNVIASFIVAALALSAAIATGGRRIG